VHASGAILTLLINLWAFRIELRNVGRNAAVIQEVLEAVDRIRQAQGLEPNAAALDQESSR
jgi:hypothetical protein